MRRETAGLLRAVLRLVENDVLELADAVVEIDEREAANSAALRERCDRLEKDAELIAARLQEHVTTYERFAHPPHPVPDGFSVKA